ncbi:MAG: carboxyl transferase domain-containing protein, partial [Myxococcaceae bacterium]
MTIKSMQELLAEHDAREQRADEGGGRARLLRHPRLGRLGARERIAALVDEGSFVELGRHVVHRHGADSDALAANQHPGDGLVCGFGAVNGRTVAVYAHDPTVMRGGLGHAASLKLCRLLDLAGERGHPVVALVDCDGVRVDEGIDAIDAYGEIIRRTVRLKGRVPQLTLVCGLCVGAAAYTATLTDCVGMIAGQSYMFITGPKVTRVVTGEEVELADLGGPDVHAKKTGAVHAVLEDERAGIEWLKKLLGYASGTHPSVTPSLSALDGGGELENLIPVEPRRAYDVRKVLNAIFDGGSLLELSPKFGGSLITAFARLGDRPVA